MTQTDIATIVASYTGVSVVAAGVVWKLFKRGVASALEDNKAQMKREMDEPINELRHNGGSSLLDVVKLQILPTVMELRETQKEVISQVSRLEGRLDQYIADSQKSVLP